MSQSKYLGKRLSKACGLGGAQLSQETVGVRLGWGHGATYRLEEGSIRSVGVFTTCPGTPTGLVDRRVGVSQVPET